MEAHRAPIDHFGRIERRRAGDMAAEAVFGLRGGEGNAAPRLVQAGEHFLRVVADGRDDAHPGDDDPLHGPLSFQ